MKTDPAAGIFFLQPWPSKEKFEVRFTWFQRPELQRFNVPSAYRFLAIHEPVRFQPDPDDRSVVAGILIPARAAAGAVQELQVNGVVHPDRGVNFSIGLNDLTINNWTLQEDGYE